ncbi:MAG: ABC transporter permease [Candidatus Heimdallarchaeota archaeon]|nr:ABC transporter permease [Candidatus Heimdallarchaeota archaeon]
MKEKYEKLTQFEKTYRWQTKFTTLYSLYIGKLWSTLIKDKKSWIFNVLVLAPIIAGPIVFLTNSGITTNEFFSTYSDIMFMGYFGIIIPLFTLYIASTMFNDEIGDRTVSYLTVRPIHRFELVFIKYLCYLTIIPVFTSLATMLNYLSFGVFGFFERFDMALWFLLITFVSSAVYGAFFMLIGLLFKNPLWFGLFFVFIWEFVLATFSRTLNNLTIGYYIKSLIVWDPFRNSLRDSPALDGLYNCQAYQWRFYNNPVNATTFSVVLAVVIIISITLSWAVLQGDKFRVPYQAGRRPGGWKYYLKEIRSYLITFGVLLITMGLVIGPVNGLKKNMTDIYIGKEIDVNPYNNDWYNFVNPRNPDITDMGWGIDLPYNFVNGDKLTAIFSIDDQPAGYYYSLTGLICNDNLYQSFLASTQELWLDWMEYQHSFPASANFINYHIQYHNLVDDFIDQVEESVSFTYYVQPMLLNYNISENGKYHIMVIVDWYDTSTDRFLASDIQIQITGEIYRKAGYSFGYIILSAGLVSMGFAIYSLVSYRSADEIQRYNERIAEHEMLYDKNSLQEQEGISESPKKKPKCQEKS